jgi:hypothetical protein
VRIISDMPDRPRTRAGQGGLAVRRDILTRVLLLTVLLLASACQTTGSGANEPDADVPMRRLAAPRGSFAGVAWLPDGRLYFGWAVEAGGDPEIWRIPAAGGAAQRLWLPNQPGCRRTRYLRVATLPDGRLGLTRLCSKAPPPTGDTGAVDPRTSTYLPLAPLEDLNPSGVTWRKNLRSGFLSRTSGSCAGIAALTHDGPQRWPTPAAMDGRTWELDGYVFAAGDVYCAGQGRADLPLLSPYETALYFVASPDSVGVDEAIRREETPWRLYRWAVSGDRPTGQPEELTGDLGKPFGLAISPDGRTLAFAGQHDRKYGLWRVDSATGAVRRLAGGKFVSASFSPDGRQLAAVFQQDADHGFLEVLDLP